MNTASLAGLVSSPMMGPYPTTKWAVVGLSLALRPEAATRGVRVSVVCPGVVDTPILDRTMPADLPPVPASDLDSRAILAKAGFGRLLPPADLAAAVLRGVDRNRALIIEPWSARIAWWAFLLSALVLAGAARLTGRLRRELLSAGSEG